jgi:hypothetical protein
MPSEESGTLKAVRAGSSCVHSSETTLLNTLFEPCEAERPLGGETLYAILSKPRGAKPPLGGEAFYAVYAG